MSVLLWFMVHSCESCLKLIREYRTLVDHLDDSLQVNLAQDFSSQLAHQSFKITANGFFEFNYQLLGSMLGSVVTYIVIMVQLDQEGLNNNSSNDSESPGVLCKEFNLAC